NQDVRIITGKLNHETYSPLASTVAEVLRGQRNVFVIVVTELDQPARNEFYQVVSSSKFGQVRILGDNSDRTHHFQLIGDIAYRVELDDDTKEAYVCFRDENR